MKDSRGIDLGHQDIVARRDGLGWRISRVALVGYVDATKSQPLAACTDFEARGKGSSWQLVTEPKELQRIVSASDLKESPEAMIQRMPVIGGLIDDFTLHELKTQLAAS